VEQSRNDTAEFERLLREQPREDYVLQLFLTGMSPRSTAALSALKAICEEFLPGRYKLEVIDIYDNPQATHELQIVAAPTLIRLRPLPQRRLIGDLSDRSVVLRTLDLG
jgi:circadian clock protein KaiB